MKRFAFLVLALCMILTSCGLFETKSNRVNEEGDPVSMFTTVETTASWKIVYHKDTLVMYAVSTGIHGSGVFSPMLNPDGTLMLWQG